MYLPSMQGDFYRATPKKRGLTMLLGSIKKNRKQVFMLVAGVFIASYFLFDNKGIVKRIRLEVQKQDLVERVEDAQKETVRLQQHIKALEGDKKTIETLAREKYGMVRQGETVYRVKK